MSRANVTILCTHLVKPTGPQAHEGPLHMTTWDQLFASKHNKTVLFYNPTTSTTQDMVETLKDSLGRALAHFSPLAGRLRWVENDPRRRLEILCNGEGAELVEAECDKEMSPYRDCTTNLENKVMALLPVVDPELPVEEVPVLMVQLTRFRCGGVALGFSNAHMEADGQAAFHFFSEWARLARGEPMKEAPSLLYRSILQERERLNNGRKLSFSDLIDFQMPPLMLGKQDATEEWNKETVNLALPLTKAQLDALKKAASPCVSDNGDKISRSFSRFVVVASHIWRCLCKARRHVYEQQTTLTLTVNVRNLIRTIPLPRATFGNMVITTRAISQAGELISNPLGFTCGKLREAINMVDEDYVLSQFELFEKQDDLSLLMKDESVFSKTPKNGKPYYGNPNVKVVSWLSLPLEGLDFGWGDTIDIIPLVRPFDGAMIFLPSPDNHGSIIVLLCLQVAHVDDFKKHFYQDIATY